MPVQIDLPALRRQLRLDGCAHHSDDVHRVTELGHSRLELRGSVWDVPVRPHWSADPFNDPQWRRDYQALTWLAPLRRRAGDGDNAARETWWWLACSWLESLDRLAVGEATPWSDDRAAVRLGEIVRGLAVVGSQPWLLTAVERHTDFLCEQPLSWASLPVGEDLLVAAVALRREDALQAAHRFIDRWIQNHVAAAGTSPEASLTEARAVDGHLLRITSRFRVENLPYADIADITAGHKAFLDALSHQETSSPKVSARDLTRAATRPEKSPAPGVLECRDGTQIAVRADGPRWVRIADRGGGKPRQTDDTLLFVPEHSDTVAGTCDGGTITYASDGVQWIDDMSRYHHGSSLDREFVDDRVQHNVIIVQGKTYRRDTEVVLLNREETHDHVDLLFRDDGYEGVTITRRLVYLKERRQLLVLDGVESDDEVLTEQRWNCGTGVSASRLDAGFILRREQKALNVTTLCGAKAISIHRDDHMPPRNRALTEEYEITAADCLAFISQGCIHFLATAIGPCDESSIDVLSSRLTPASLSGAVRDIVPNALLARSEKVSRIHHDPDHTGLAVSMSHTAQGLVYAAVRGGGPDYAFHLVRPDGVAVRTPYPRRTSHSFHVDEPQMFALRVFSRNESGKNDIRTVAVA